MRPRETFEGSRGPLPYQFGEKPYTNVRNLTDTTHWKSLDLVSIDLHPSSFRAFRGHSFRLPISVQ